MYLKMVVAQVKAHSNANAVNDANITADRIREIIVSNTIDRVMNDAALDEMMNLKQFKDAGISRIAAAAIAQDVSLAGSTVSNDEITGFTISEMIKDKSGFDSIKNGLDLNLLFETMYGTKQNPITGIAGVIGTIKFRITFMIFLMK